MTDETPAVAIRPRSVMVLALSILASQLAMGRAGTEPATDTIVPPEYVGRKKVDRLFKSMEQGTYKLDLNPGSPGRLSSADIPFLLERAGSKTVLTCFPVNALSSEMQNQCSEGMVALWLVEGVRKGSYFPSLNALCLNINRDHLESDWARESESNHPKVTAAYKKWWKQGHTNLVATFKKNPLEGTELVWH